MTTTFLSRRATAGFFLTGGVLTAVGLAVTPWEDEQTSRSYLDALAAHPTQAQIAAIALHLGYLLLATGAFGALVVLAGAKGIALRLGGLLTILGATTMPGLLIVDAYDIALAQELPRDTGVRVSDAVGDLPMSTIISMPAMVGFLLGGILLTVALWRAGEVPGTVPVLVLLGWLVPFVSFTVPAMIAGGILLAVGYGLLAARLRPAPEAPATPPTPAPGGAADAVVVPT